MSARRRALGRSAAALRGDLRLLARYGIVSAAAVITVLWILLLRLLPPAARDIAVPLVVFGDLAIIGVFFIGGMVLFERGEGTISALATSPLSFSEYLVARLVALTMLAIASSLGLVVATGAPGVNLWVLTISVALLSVISLLAGFITVAPFDAVSRYVIPSVAPLLVLAIPLLGRLGVLGGPFLLLLPTQGPMIVLNAAFDGGDAVGLALATLSSAVWIAALWRSADWAFRRWVVPAGGQR